MRGLAVAQVGNIIVGSISTLTTGSDECLEWFTLEGNVLTGSPREDIDRGYRESR